MLPQRIPGVVDDIVRAVRHRGEPGGGLCTPGSDRRPSQPTGVFAVTTRWFRSLAITSKTVSSPPRVGDTPAGGGVASTVTVTRAKQKHGPWQRRARPSGPRAASPARRPSRPRRITSDQGRRGWACTCGMSARARRRAGKCRGVHVTVHGGLTKRR